MNYLRPVAILIFSYITIFVIWWIVLLTRLENNNLELQQQLYEMKHVDSSAQQLQDISAQSNRANIMIVSEGIVFLLILFISFLYLFKTIAKEERLNKLQQNFLLATTHEFKTPLATTRLNLQTLNKPLISDQQRQRLIDNSIKEVDRLNQMVKNILASSKINHGGQDIIIEPLDLNQFTLDFKKSRPNPRIVYDIDEDLIVHADHVALNIVLSNLVDNALKYSSDNEVVRVFAKSHDGIVTIEVVDQGIGIPKSEQEKIFDMFYRIGDENVRKKQGTGLGLYLVKQLTKLMKGQVSVSSQEDKETSFKIKLPGE